jgi:hypothetical protein
MCCFPWQGQCFLVKIDALISQIGASSPQADHDIVGAGNRVFQTYENLHGGSRNFVSARDEVDVHRETLSGLLGVAQARQFFA